MGVLGTVRDVSVIVGMVLLALAVLNPSALPSDNAFKADNSDEFGQLKQLNRHLDILPGIEGDTDGINSKTKDLVSNTASILLDTGDINQDTSNIDSNTDELENNTDNLEQINSGNAENTHSIDQTVGVNGSSVGGFGRVTVNNFQTRMDIPSHFKFSPERLRLFKNGEREYVQYETHNTSTFVDEADVWSLRPGNNDNMTLESAESNTYSVGSAMQATYAFQLNESLDDGEAINVGLLKDGDGWYMRHEGSMPNSSVVDLYARRDGSDILLEEEAVLPRPVTDWARYELNFNWYNVGNQDWTQTYTVDGRQVNKQFARTSIDGNRGPQQANLNLIYQVENDGSGGQDVEFETGSMSFSVKTGGEQLVRSKPQYETTTLTGSNNVWEPVYAFKLSNGGYNNPVNADITNLDIVDYTNDADVELLAVSFDNEKTDATGFGVPNYQHEQNSVLRDTFTVSQVADDGGVLTDPASTDFKFGGYVLSADVLSVSGQGSKVRSRSTDFTIQRQVLNSDHVVLLARSPSVGGDLKFTYNVRQEW